MPANNQAYLTEMSDRLRRAAEVLAGRIRSLAPTRKIKSAVSVKAPVADGQAGMHVDVAISLQSAPEALAYELGSGLHGRLGAKYIIAPKNVRALAFFWDKVNESSPTGRKFLGISPTTGKAIFSFVEHPGVAARPYIKPAIEQTKSEMTQIIGREFGVSILTSLGDLLADEVQ